MTGKGKRVGLWFHYDRLAIGVLLAAAVVLTGWRWLQDHPQHDPWAPLRLSDPVGWATRSKLARLRDEPAECRGFLSRNEVAFMSLPPQGAGACLANDRTLVVPDRESGLALRPANAVATCAVNAGLALWLRHGLQPAARGSLGSRVIALEHLGTGNCRRIGRGEGGRWSEHATGNAIDISAFVLADGRRISVLKDWPRATKEGAFLLAARDAGCGIFATVLSPEYNAAHADHLHLDQAGRLRGWSFCR